MASAFEQGAAPNVVTGKHSQFGQEVLTLPVLLSGVADTETIQVTIPFAFRVESAGFRVGDTVGAGAGATITFTPSIGSTAITGGVVTPTLATTTPAGALVAGTTITGANTGAAGAVLTFTASSVTAFTAGNGWLEVAVSNTESVE